MIELVAQALSKASDALPWITTPKTNQTVYRFLARAAVEAMQAHISKMDWCPIDIAPRDGTHLLIHWPRYAYGVDDTPEAWTAIGWWKHNDRLDPNYPSGVPRPNAQAIIAELKEIDGSPDYFADSEEVDDYGLSLAKHAPTYWMLLPANPT